MGKIVKVFMTGITGFVGQNLVQELSNKGYKVAGLVRPDAKAKKPEALALLQQCEAELFFGDLADYDCVFKSLKAISKETNDLVVIHLATVPSSSDYESLYKVNVVGTENLYAALVEANIQPKQIIHLSTASIYGPNHNKMEIAENYNKFAPQTSYEKTKLRGEEIAREFMLKKNLPLTILRPVHVYGPGHIDSMITQMVRMAERGFLVAPSPSLQVDLVYVKNLADAISLCIGNEQAIGETYLVTDGRTYQVKDLLDSVHSVLGAHSRCMFIPRLALRVYSKFTHLFRYSLNGVTFSGKKLALIGYNPRYDLKTGIREYVDWLQKVNYGKS